MFKRAFCLTLVVLHLATFGPIREALAFSSSSTSYRLSTGTLSQGGASRSSMGVVVEQDVIGEPCAGKITSSSFILTSGYIPTLSSNPPEAGHIPAQFWQKNTSHTLDLDDYFLSPDGYSLSYTFTKLTPDAKINLSLDPETHVVTFTPPQDFSGTEKVTFTAADTEGGSAQSNNVRLQVLGEANQPVIEEIIAPRYAREGESTTLVIKAIDRDADNLQFSYESYFATQPDTSWQVNTVQDTNDPTRWTSTVSFNIPTDKSLQGYYSVIVTVREDSTTGLFDTEEIPLRVGDKNTPPLIASINENPVVAGQPLRLSANEGQLLVLNVGVNDADNNTIQRYYPEPFNSEGKWDIPYDTVTGGQTSIIRTARIAISDRIDTVYQDVEITVNNVDRPPRIKRFEASNYTLSPGESTVIDFEPYDPDNEAMLFTLYKDGQPIGEPWQPIENGATHSINLSFSTEGNHIISAEVKDLPWQEMVSGNLPSPIDVTTRKNVNPVMGDFNGDSLTDLGLHNYKTGEWEIALSDRGELRSVTSWLSNFGTSDTSEWIPIGGDFNGDGKGDVAVYKHSSGELKVALSDGTKFSGSMDTTNWLKADFASSSWLPFTGNFNADKYTDFALYNKDSGEVRVALGAAGNTFGGFSSWLSGNDALRDYTPSGGDFNGDSLTDICLFKKSTGEFKVLFSNSRQFVDGFSWSYPGFPQDKEALISDFNNDGFTDVGYWNKGSTWYVAISTGSTFVDKGVWLQGFGSSDYDSATTGDFNGDGLTDTACFKRDEVGIRHWLTRLSNKKPADLLKLVDNSMGGKTRVDYTYYSAQSDEESLVLPFPVYVTAKVALENYLSANLPIGAALPQQPLESYVQNFNYSGGYFDFSEREFRGFAKVTVTDPASGNYSETYFHQGKQAEEGALKGQIKEIKVYDGGLIQNRLISHTLNEYTVIKGGQEQGGRFLGFPALTRQVTTAYEENNQYITTTDTSVYDNIGNLLEQSNIISSSHPDDRPGEKRTFATLYTPAYENGFNRPREVTLRDKDSKIITQKSLEYWPETGNLFKEIVLIINPLTQETGSAITQYFYDSFGNLTRSINALNRTMQTEYEEDFHTFPRRVTNDLGQTISYVYDPKFAAVIEATDANQRTTFSHYDSLGRLEYVENAKGEIPTRYEYDYPNFNLKRTRQLDLVKTEYIDGLGRKYRTVSSGEDEATGASREIIAETFYNQRGLVDRESLPHYIDEPVNNIAYVRYSYDIRGRLKISISDFRPSEAITTAEYLNRAPSPKDTRSEIIYGAQDRSPLYNETIDPKGHRKGALKDVYGNLVEVSEFTSEGDFKTRYEYDLQNNLTKVTDSQGQDNYTRGMNPNVTQVFYDSLGRKLRMFDPDMGKWNYEYDLVGNLIKQTDAKGQVLEFEYDALNRLTAKRYTLNANTVTLATYLYDSPPEEKANCIGRLSKIIYQSGSTEFFYDELGREVESIKTVNATRYTVKRDYDLLDRLTKLTYPDGDTVTYDYNANSGLLETVNGTRSTVNATYVSHISYNASGQIRKIQYGNNTQTDYVYGQDFRLSNILTKNSAEQELQNLTYSFDSNGNLEELGVKIPSTGQFNRRTFIYDDLDRLIRAEELPHPDIPNVFTTFSYRYDCLGNMRYKNEGSTPLIMDYGDGPSPVTGTIRPHALASAGGFSYRYDDNGNMIVGKNKNLEYDAENRLTKVIEPNSVSTFTYDGDGGRVSKTQ